MTFSVVLVGLGDIGYGFDRNIKHPSVQTHFSAFDSSEQFNVILGVDVDPVKRQLFEKETNIPVSKGYPEGISADVAVIASSGRERSHLLESTIISLEPSVILCEKPLSHDLDDLDSIERLLKKYNTSVFLNYFRRALPEFQFLKKSFSSGEFGNVRKCNIWYSKGILNSASHFVDLIGWLLEENSSFFQVSEVKLLSEDGDLFLRINSVPCYFLVCDEHDFFHNTAEIVTSRARLKLDRAGRCVVINKADCRDANGLPTLNFDSEVVKVDFATAQSRVSIEIGNFLSHGECVLSDARKIVEVTKELIAVQNLLKNQAKEI